MRLHNNNEKYPFITDKDIIVTDGDMTSDNGKLLHTVINEHDTKINKLESNVKWMYRYGALGSGGTGGGGGSNKSKIQVLIFKDAVQAISPGTRLVYSTPGTYKLKIEIHGGGSDSFLVKYFINGKSYQKILSKDNSFETTENIRFEGNGELTMTIFNQSEYVYYEINGNTTLTFPYITSAYNITANYVDAVTLKRFNYNNNLIFMNDISSHGLMIALNYNIAVEIFPTLTQIEYTDWENRDILIDNSGMHITANGTVSHDPDFKIKIDSNSAGVLYLPLASNITEFLQEPSNAAFKQLTLTVKGKLRDDSESDSDELYEFARFNFNDNLIPRGLFLNIKTTAGKLYNNANAASTANILNQIIIGDIGFVVTPYNGSLDTSRNYKLRTYVYDVENNEEIYNEDSSSTNPITLIDQKETDIIIPISDIGVKKLVFELTYVENISTVKTYEYYIQTRAFPSTFNWYPNIIERVGNQDVLVELEPYYSAIYRRNSVITNLQSDNVFLSPNSNIQMTSNDSIRKINLNYDNVNTDRLNEYDVLMSIGLQYSTINNTNIPILSFDVDASTNEKKLQYSIFLYQDKLAVAAADININNSNNIAMTSQDIGIFIPLEDDYKPADTTKYHLFNIYKRFENNSSINYYRSVSVYIDGVLEGLLGKYSTVDKKYTSITLYPGNYTINLLELSLFNHAEHLPLEPQQSQSSDRKQKLWMEDIDITRYFRSYTEKILNISNLYDDDDAQLFNAFNNFKIDSENRIIVDYDDIVTIARLANCPTMLLEYDENFKIYSTKNTDNFITWFERSYNETQNIIGHVPVNIKYSDGTHKGLEYINLPEYNDDGTYKNSGTIKALFYVDIQGSSTKEYRVKNLELYAPSSGETITTYDYIYSPNICRDENDPNFTESFLPENSFTLKADIVDSSHTNNNAIGKFVNDNTTPFKQARDKAYQHSTKYAKNIKNTLIGFPILLFLHTTYKLYDSSGNETPEEKSTYYFLGIYNFNLGRKSYYNLGYKDTAKIEHLIDDPNAPNSGFVIYKIDSDENIQMDNIVGGEIQGNNKFFDFSQYSNDDPNLLFNEKYGMWGDFIGNKDKVFIQRDIANFCKKVAFAGGFIFNELNKDMSVSEEELFGYKYLYSKIKTEIDENGQEKITECVPNYHYQFTARTEGTNIVYSWNYISQDGIINDLLNLITTWENENVTNIPALDYTSVSEYYTVMMAMGLVDSPMKNLNIKSWNNGQTFYLAFYDMDTGLGKSNAGTYINYFAFSDFWRSQRAKEGTSLIDTLKQVKIIRDYAPEEFSVEETSSSFFDVPSNYLFAVAKYAKVILESIEGSLEYSDIVGNDPSNIWGKWRMADGCLSSARAFMQNYFNHHLVNIPEESLNFNYRYKYLKKDEDNKGFESLNFMKFHGRGKAYTEYWLDGRLHILDAYFNVSGIDDVISVKDNREITAPYTDITAYADGMASNPDVYILQDAFSGNSTAFTYPSSSSGHVTIEARPYAPMIVAYPQRKERYLFPNNGEKSQIFIDFTGTVSVLFGGSKLWTAIGSITPFITLNNTFSIHSKYISTIIGESRVCNDWTFDTPALRTLRLTSPNYSGAIEFKSSLLNPTYQNLDEIVISNTAIKLSIENIPLRVLYATNMQEGAEISVINCDKLEDVQISGNFQVLQLCSWSNDISLPTGGNLTCKEIQISNNVNRFPNASLHISNNSELTTLIADGFSHIYINNCPNLVNLSLGDSHLIQTLDIQMPRYNPELNFSITNENTDMSIGGNIVDLSNFINLTTLRLSNTTVSYVILPNMVNGNNVPIETRNIMLPSRAFYNCKNFVNFLNENNNKMYITGDATFNNTGVIGTEINEQNRRFNFVQEGHANNVENPNITNVWVDSSCTSLKDTFNCIDNKGLITFEVAKKFLLERCNNCDNVITIENMFKNNSINYSFVTGATEYLNEKCSLSLGVFTSCVNATDIFTNNNVIFFNKYMFISDDNTKIFAQNISDINLTTIANTFSAGTIDMFEYVMSKTVSIDFRQQNNIMIYKPETGTVQNLYNTYNELEISKIFNNPSNGYFPTKLVNIRNFTISPTYNSSGGQRTQRFTFKGLFDNDVNNQSNFAWTNAHANGLFLNNFMNATYTINNYDSSYVNLLFSKLVPNVINNSIGGFITTDTNLTLMTKQLHIYTMFDWQKVSEKTTNLFSDDFIGQNFTFGGLNVDKYCYYNEFKEIWQKLIQSEILKSISSIFTNCSIYKSSDLDNRWNPNDILSLTDSDEIINTTITTVPSLFSNFKLIQGNGIQNDAIYPINITTNFFKCVKKLTYVANIFENTYMKHAIPFDIFNKRKISNNNVSCFILKNDEFVPATLIKHDYDNTIINMNNAFYNVTFENKTSATFKHNYDDNDYNIFEKDYVYVSDEPNVHYDEYYLLDWNALTNKYEYTLHSIEQPSEIQDIDNLYNEVYVSTYTEYIKDYSLNNRYYRNLSNFCPNGFVVSPDIFRCCSERCSINSTLAVSNRNNTNNFDPVVMTGMLPPSLFGVDYLRKIDFTGTLTGLNVTPICMNIKDPMYEYDDSITIVISTNPYLTRTIPRHNICYQFVWDNFTEKENLSGCFNFMLLLPSTTSEEDNNFLETSRTTERFYMFSDKSFTKDVIKLSDTLPYDINHKILEDMDVDHMHEFYLKNNEIHFNIMGYIETRTDENTGATTTALYDGISPIKFRSLSFDSMINGDIAKIYSGYVVSSDVVWRSIYMSSDGASVFFQVGGNNTGWIGLSLNAKIQAKMENNGFFPRVGTGYKINVQSFSLGADFLSDENYKLYWTGYDFIR